MLAARLVHPSAMLSPLPGGAQEHAASHSVFRARQGQLVWNAPSSMLYVPNCPGLQLWPWQPPFLLVCSFHLISACSSGSSYSVKRLYRLRTPSDHDITVCIFTNAWNNGADSVKQIQTLGAWLHSWATKVCPKKTMLHEPGTNSSPCCAATATAIQQSQQPLLQ